MSYSVLIRLVLSFSDGRSFNYTKLRLVGISFIPKLFPTISLSQSLIPSLGCVERFTGILECERCRFVINTATYLVCFMVAEV